MEKSAITNSRGVINAKKLSKVLGLTDYIKPNKSVAKPLEPTTTQLPAQEILTRSIESFKSSAELMKKYSQECYYIFEIMMASGCRVSEVLSIRAVDIMINGMIRVKGKKKSNDRIISAGKALDYIMRCKKNNVAPFQFVNRKFVWTVFKKFGIQLNVGSSEKKVVTHAIRHLVIASAKDSSIENNTTGNFIGHKNKKNTERYGQIKKS